MWRNAAKCSRVFPFVLLTLLLALAPAARGQVTNWVAYNDHRPGPIIPPHVSTPSAWGTAQRVTTLDMGAPADTTGNLVDFLTGNSLPATVTFTRTGAPDDFGTVVRPMPTNTPAGRLFYKICDLSNDGVIGVDALDGDFVTITFANLNPTKRYVFRGTGARNGGYAPRWTVAQIVAGGWIDAHLNGAGPGVITSNNFPNLIAGEAAWNSGANSEGAVVGWDFIAPAADGTFSITCKQYVGPTPNGGVATDANYGYSFGAMLLAEVEVAAPVITSHPAASTTVEQNRSLSLSVAATGTPLLYQWYKEVSGAIPGATFATFSIPQAAVADSGNYYAVVYNPLSRATSTVAHVTVNADVTAPGIAIAFAYPSVAGAVATHDQIIVEFNEPVTLGSVGNPVNYTVPGGGNPTSVVITNDRTVVLTLATPLAEDTAYSLTARGMVDAVGNTAGSVSASFRTWLSGPGNGLLFEAFQTGPGVEVVQLTSSPNYPSNPYLQAILPTFDTRAIYPNDDVGDYGARIRGVFIPPVSGNWVFYLRTFDRGVVYLNPNGLDPDGAIEILRESTGNNPRNWDKFTSPVFALRAGQGYYIEGQYKADTTTADVMKVAARLAGTGFPQPVDLVNTDLDPNAISGAAVGYPLAPRDFGGPLTIVQGPVNTTVEANHPATFSVVLNNPSKAAVFYQWFRDGTAIPNGTGPTYTLQAVSADSGATFSVQVAKIGSSATSGTATLTVVPDITPPHALSASSPATNLNEVVVVFDENVEPGNAGSAEDEFNYLLNISNPGSALLDPDGKTVRLIFVETLLLGSVYQIEVNGVTDLGGLFMSPAPTVLTFTAGVVASPTLAIELAGATVVISWPAAATGFTLEQADEIVLPVSAIAWSPVGTAPTVVNGRNTVTLAVSGNKVFRLRQ